MNIMMLYTYVYYIYILLLLYMQKFYWPQSLELWLISKIGLLKIDNDASQQLLKSFWLLNEYWRATSTHLQFNHVWLINIALWVHWTHWLNTLIKPPPFFCQSYWNQPPFSYCRQGLWQRLENNTEGSWF